MSDNSVFTSLAPQPKEIRIDDGVFLLMSDSPINANFAGAERLGYLLRLCGQNSVPTHKVPQNSPSGTLHLTIGNADDDSANDLYPKFPGDEAYALKIEPKLIRAAARTVSGIAMALKTLAKTVKNFDGRDLPCVTIQDAPSLDFRGLHLCIFNPNDGTEKEDTSPESIRSMLELAAMSGYRYVFLEFWGMFPYQRHPYAVWPNTAYTTDVVRGLINHAIDDLHITPLPCQNLASHAGWSRIISRKHVVLDQRPDLAEMWIPGGWCFATENSNTKAFLRDVIDELVDAYRRPPMFHVSCDKCFGFGSTEADRTKPADLLFGNHLCFLNSTLQEHGARMVMWADMLYTSMDALYWKASPAIADMLPRNILMNIWTHNDPGEHWADVDFFESRGFQTIYSPFLDHKGVASMTNVCLRRNSHGILQTTWHRPQTAQPTVVFSGACQWEGSSI